LFVKIHVEIDRRCINKLNNGLYVELREDVLLGKTNGKGIAVPRIDGMGIAGLKKKRFGKRHSKTRMDARDASTMNCQYCYSAYKNKLNNSK
jgi:hypothetical protein